MDLIHRGGSGDYNYIFKKYTDNQGWKQCFGML